jgi:hypothetical protein
MKRVSLRYCGCCNPQLDLRSLLEDALRRIGGRDGPWELVPFAEEAEVCLLLNGCPVGCARAEGCRGKAIERAVIRGWKADGSLDWGWEKGEGGNC